MKRSDVHSYIERHEVAWELAFAVLAIIFVALGFVDPSDGTSLSTLVAIEWAITALFAAEFAIRMWAAPDRKAHLRAHWVDLVSVIPPARWLRPFRLLRLLRLVRAFAGVSRAMAHLETLATHRGLVWMVAAWFAVSIIASIGLYTAEHGVNAAFQEPLDAVWWGVVTLSTVGYGDAYPVTPEGRVAAMSLMILGVGLYSAITSAVTSYFVSQGSRQPSVVDELDRLARLHEQRRLDDREFTQAKAAVLGTGMHR